MTQAHSKSSAPLLLLGIILLAVFLLAVQVTRPLLPIDETRYVSVAWEMWTRSDFLVPHLNGLPYSHKPPLLMWSIHLGWALFGVNEWWPRSVALAYGIGSLLMLRLLALRLWPGEKALANLAAFVLATCLWWMLFSTATMFDVLLAFWVIVAMWAITVAPESPVKGFIVLGLAMGAGILTKGPVMLLHVFPLAVLAPWWRPGLAWRRWMGGVLAALALAVAVVLAWAIPAALAGGEAYRQAIFWGQTANRMVQSFAHRHPVWWYLPWVPLMLSPWALWPTLWKRWVGWREAPVDHSVRFCLAWIIPVFLAFCFISGKQPHYLMPLLPAVALLVARALNGNEPKGSLLVPSAIMVLLGGLAIVITTGVIGGTKTAELVTLSPWPGVAIVLGAVIAWAWTQRSSAVSPTLVLGTLGWWTALNLLILLGPMLMVRHDVRPIALGVEKLQQDGVTVAHLGAYHDQFHFLGRLTKPLAIVDERPAHTLAWLRANPSMPVLLYSRKTDELQGTSPLLQTPYRGRVAVILSPADALTVIERRASSAAGPASTSQEDDQEEED